MVGHSARDIWRGIEIHAWAMGFLSSSGALFGYYIIILTGSITCGAIIRGGRIR